MSSRHKYQKPWNIILFSDPKTTIKKFHITKFMLICSIVLFSLVSALISVYIYLLFEEKNVENELLNEEILLRDQQIEVANNEVEEVKREYTSLQIEAVEVQQSIEKFRAYEEQLNELELELPGGRNYKDDGSGGIEFPSKIEEINDISNRLTEIRDDLPNLINEFEIAIDRLIAYEEELRSIPTIMPTEGGRITSTFGNRIDPITRSSSFHSGIDIASTLNTPIYATADGTVTEAGWDSGGYGRMVVIKHNDAYETVYAHLNSIEVSAGDYVKKGEMIGGMGSTGRSTGVHLHYEILRNGEYVDPYQYMIFHENLIIE
ncbi:peptidoglycan DD-metalloendopeptidase family protein [Evansella cellulosilytica]|uniref:Peptidase M23 n=1 Tax=Evansella cellulosilytica (strain ATCC 21833 / DSM 2522 / FERM P-1141 / JCM 9156 / N-4) TaxID=649639 RepID=E6TRA9_EVAC2|nr:peptidoglycan DD-metalloendopeptidase family protein [Evansella cellulosilytica]ADU30621.1 Peptidase M23 [Evansella cellulosilytica DSM 2522]